MRTIHFKLFFLIIRSSLLTILLVSCVSNNFKLKEKQLELKEKELKIKEKELELKANQKPLNHSNSTEVKKIENEHKSQTSVSNPIGATKFAFVEIITEEPQLTHLDAFYNEDILSGRKTKITDEINGVGHNKMVYVSEIQEINNYAEDSKYKLMDKFRSTISKRLSLVQNDFEFDVSSKINSSRSEVERLQSMGNAKIITIKAFTFDSYKDASISSSKIVK